MGADLRTVGAALKMYRLDNGAYPTTEQGLQSLVTRPADPNIKNWKEGGYIDGLKKDPWGNDYSYECPGRQNQTSYDLTSPGPDGKLGSDDDVSNFAGKK